MDYSQLFAISAAGMNLERARVDVAALNLANANTVQTTQGGAYRPLRVVARPGGMAAVGGQIFSTLFDNAMSGAVPQMVQPNITIEAVDTPPRTVYEPGHPMANEKGYVTYAGVDTATEMVTLMSAMRSYESNVAALNAARSMAMKALEIGGGS
jgi:flagellar basal-body rod protein FlgC